ncbi:MAG: hypothetical protein AB8I08_15790 [Sandaracinaceae bacterium]
MRSQPTLVPTTDLRSLDLMQPAPLDAPRRIQAALSKATKRSSTATAAALGGVALATAGSVAALVIGALAVVIVALLATGVAVALVAFAGLLVALSVCALAAASLTGASWMVWVTLRGVGRLGEWMGRAMARSSMVTTAALEARPSVA